MVSDVVYNRCDISIIVSADSDLTPPIHFIREFNKSHKIFVYFPPNRYSSNLKALANNIKKLDGSTVAFGSNLLPGSIILPSGYVINRPTPWK